MKQLSLLSLAALMMLSGCYTTNNKPAAKPVKALYITSAGWFHQYEEQIALVHQGLSKDVAVSLDIIVGDVERLKQTDFAAGYDLLIYNFCHAAQRDEEFVESLIRPVYQDGKPLIALHCTMHSFQFDKRWPVFLGLKTLRHEKQRSFEVTTVGEHELLNNIAASFSLASDELYLTIEKDEKITPLLNAYGVESKAVHTQGWLYQSGKGEVIATTLGHHQNTLSDQNFQQFLANSVTYLTKSQGENRQVAALGEGKITVLSENAKYPDSALRQCVIHNMFSIGGEKVNACIEMQCNDQNKEQCTKQCQEDNPWPVPETLWDDCQSGKLTAPKQ